jgi:NAD(P)-dependent dehydrogenase (short-subunit alcohol dehydrogenase family)
MTAKRFKAQVIVITGARGMGVCMGQRFAREGAAVVAFIDTDQKAAQQAVDAVMAAGAVGVFFNASITNPLKVQTAIDALKKEYHRIDVLVNHAGGAYPVGQLNVNNLTQMDIPGWDASVELNLSGPYYCSRAVIPAMKEQGKGVIVHIGSVNGQYALGHPAYSAAKAGLVSLSRSIAVELGKYGIRSNVISPGTVRTIAWDERIRKNPKVLDVLKKYYPVQHIIDAEDVAAAVCFMASDEARSISGAELLVDGGLSAGSSAMSQELTQEKF